MYPLLIQRKLGPPSVCISFFCICICICIGQPTKATLLFSLNVATVDSTQTCPPNVCIFFCICVCTCICNGQPTKETNTKATLVVLFKCSHCWFNWPTKCFYIFFFMYLYLYLYWPTSKGDHHQGEPLNAAIVDSTQTCPPSNASGFRAQV